MSRDELLSLLLVVAFAGLITTHAVLVAGLAARRPRWRALVALVLAPAAPYWGIKQRLYARAVAWLACALAYAALLWTATR